MCASLIESKYMHEVKTEDGLGLMVTSMHCASPM